MKRLLLISAILLINISAHSQSRWSIGVLLGGAGNVSEFSGGMTDANALFSNSAHGSGMIGVNARYKINERLSLQSGFNFSEIGFTWLLAKDYSLLKPLDHYSELKNGTCISRVPALVVYNSKLNCRNIRFIAGAGFAVQGLDKNWKSETTDEVQAEEMNNTRVTQMTEETYATASANASFAWLLGMEKVFSKGTMLRFSFEGNHGFTPVATSTVYYAADNKEYAHTFTNYATFFSFGISYYFKPVGSRKMNKVNELMTL